MVDQYPELTEALDELRARIPEVSKAREFYNGDQKSPYPDALWKKVMDGYDIPQPRENMCTFAVDTVVSRMVLEGIMAREDEEVSNKGAEQAEKILRRNRADVLLPQLWTELGKTSKGYVILGVNSKGQAVFYPQLAEECYVSYDPEFRGQRAWGVRVFLSKKRWRANVYFPEGTLRLVSKKSTYLDRGSLPLSSDEFIEFSEDGQDSWLENPLGVVPLYEWDIDRSDLHNIFNLQTQHDLTLCNISILSHLAGYPQRYIIGAILNAASDDERAAFLGSSTDPELQLGENFLMPAPVEEEEPGLDSGPDKARILANENAKVGQLDPAPLEGNLKFAEMSRTAILRNGSTPPHLALVTNGDYPSGKSLRTAEAQFVTKVESRDRIAGNGLEDLLADAVLAENSHNPDGTFRALAERPDLETTWKSAYTDGGLEAEERIDLLLRMVPAAEVLEREFGYSAQEAEKLADAFMERRAKAQEAARFAIDAGTEPLD